MSIQHLIPCSPSCFRAATTLDWEFQEYDSIACCAATFALLAPGGSVAVVFATPDGAPKCGLLWRFGSAIVSASGFASGCQG